MNSVPPLPEDRLRNVEVDVASIKARLDAELPHLATKSDVEHVSARVERMGRLLIMWTVGTGMVGISVISGISFTAIRFAAN